MLVSRAGQLALDALAQAQTLLESTAYLAPVCGIAEFITALSKKPKGPGWPR